MSESPPRFPAAATTLAEAYQAFNPRQVVRRLSPEQLTRIYERRSTHHNVQLVRTRLKLAVEDDAAPMHALYIGPSGCGKSTELTWLAHALGDDPGLTEQLLVVHYGISEAVGEHEVGFAEVAMSMVLELYARLDEEGTSSIPRRHLEQIRELLYGTEQAKHTEKVVKEGRVGGGLLGLLKAALSGRVARETQVRVRIQHFLPELHELVTGLLERVQDDTGRTVLFVVDDLEKLTPLDTALGLFLNHGGFFRKLPCHLIFTAPSALQLEPRYQPEVLKVFEEFRSVLARPEIGGEREEFATFRNIVFRRMAPELALPAAVDEAIRMSGGVVAHLIDALHRAILFALSEDAARIELPHVKQALDEMMMRFEKLLKAADYPVLAAVNESGLRTDVTRPELLHNLSVLEYPDSPTFFALHPLVRPLLEREQRRGRLGAR